jgi:dTDP-4-dehydrorhamnose 3,5-epimerase-like enzyme
MGGPAGKQPDSPRAAVSTRRPRSFHDSRGATAILAESERLDFVEYIEFKAAGDVRGAHLHREYEERLYLIEGRLEADFLDLSDGDCARALESVELGAGELLLIPAAVAHRFTAKEPSRAIAFGSGPSPLVDRESVDWAAAQAEHRDT